MIAVRKSAQAPRKLTTTGATHRAAMERAYDQNPAACLAPKSKLLRAQKSIYGHPTVKQLLKDDQCDKCCYCETDFTATYHGDVEHFRPKAGYQQQYGGHLAVPGFYWLAYEWTNLYFACALCNQTYKGNSFPLANQAAGWADGHTRDTTAEQPRILDLTTENPEEHLTFKEDIVKARKGAGRRSARGKACITAYGLNRLEVADRRREFLRTLTSDYLLASLQPSDITTSDPENEKLIISLVNRLGSVEKFVEHVEKAKRRLYLAAQDSAEFASMVRAFMRKNPAYAAFIAPPSPSLAAAAWKRSYHL